MSPKTETPSLASKALGMGAMTGVSRILGLFRSQIMAALLGTSALGDAFFVAFRFPNLLRRLFAEGAMSAGFIPVFTELMGRKNDSGPRADQLYLEKIFTLLLAAVSLLAVLAIAFAPLILDLYYVGDPNLDPASKMHSRLLFQIMFPYLLFITLASVCQGVLNAKNEFVLPAATPIFLNLAIIAGAFAFTFFYKDHADPAKVYYLAVGVLVGGLLQFLLQVPRLYTLGYRLRLDFALMDPEVGRFVKLLIPTIFSAGIYQLNILLTDPLALALGEGAFSALNYSIRLQELPLGMIVVSVATVSLPLFSRSVAEKKESLLSEQIGRSLSLTSAILFPIILASLFFGNEIISLLYAWGSFDQKAVSLTASCFFYHILSILFVGFARILTNVFFALQDTRTPLKVSILGLVLNLALAWTLSRVLPMGVAGLALAGGLASLGMAVYYFAVLRKRIGLTLGKEFFLTQLKILLALAPVVGFYFLFKKYNLGEWAMFSILKSLSPLWLAKSRELLTLTLSTIGMVVLYGGGLWLFRVREAEEIWRRIRRRK